MKQTRWITAPALSLLVAIGPASVLAGLGDDDDDAKTIKQLTQQLKSKDAEQRAKAADELGAFGARSKGAVAALIELNKDKDWNVRLKAIQTLGSIGKDLKGEGPEAKATVKLLLEALKDTKAPDSDRYEVCQAILDSLGMIASREEGGHAKTVVPAVLPFLKHKDGFVRGHACDALAECKDHAKSAVPTLVQMLKDSHDYAKKSAGQALREIDPETAKKHGIE